VCLQGEPLLEGHPDNEDAPHNPPRSSAVHKRQHQRIHRQLQLSKSSRAARVLCEGRLASPTDNALKTIQRFHPHDDLPGLLAATEPSVTVMPHIWLRVLRAVPRGSAAGTNGWTYKHVQAAAVHGCLEAEAAAIEFLMAVVQWTSLKSRRSCRPR
jgi:hypothetical protein